jgi:hypothetical protein
MLHPKISWLFFFSFLFFFFKKSFNHPKDVLLRIYQKNKRNPGLFIGMRKESGHLPLRVMGIDGDEVLV